MTELVHSRRNRHPRSRSRSSTFYAAADSAMQLQSVRTTWRIRWSRIFYLLLVAALTGLLIFFFASSRFYVHQVELSGNQLLSEQDIYETVSLRGWSIFYVSPQRIEAQILEHFACVRDVQVRCQLPSRVRIRVEEREPSIVWESKTGRRYLVDAEGTVIKLANQMEDMILIATSKGEEPAPGDTVDSEIISTAQELAAMLGTRAFRYTRDYGLSVVAPQGYRIYFGTGGDLAVKVANLRALAHEIERQGLTNVAYVDVRFESRLSYGFDH